MLLVNGSNLNTDFCNKIFEILKTDPTFKKTEVSYTPRVVGDLVQLSINNNIQSTGYNKTKTKITKRSMADVEITDDVNNLVRIDIKTHYINADFSMPNLCSTKRLYNFYKNKNNYFAILMVEYDIVNGLPVFTNVWLLPIENLSWGCLSIGNLGWGQIQIKDAKVINFNFDITREEWIKQFKEEQMMLYIDKLKKKINKMETFFFNV